MPGRATLAGKLSPEERTMKVSLLLYNNLLVLPPPGLSVIKESDLGTKVVKVVPGPFKNKYPKQSEAATSKEKERKKNKGKKSRDAKQNKRKRIKEYNK